VSQPDLTRAQREPTKKPTSRLTKLVVWGVILVVLAFLGWGLIKRGESRPGVGETAPNFTLRLFDGYFNEFQDGSVTLSDLRGRIVVINFWASWCTECRDEARELEETWQSYRDLGVVFIGVGFHDTEEKAIGYLQEFGITYPSGLDGRGLITESKYRVTGVPETFIVDATGSIAVFKWGPFRPGELAQELDKLLAAP